MLILRGWLLRPAARREDDQQHGRNAEPEREITYRDGRRNTHVEQGRENSEATRHRAKTQHFERVFYTVRA